MSKILVADDSKVMRQIVVRTLRQAGYGGHDIIEADNCVFHDLAVKNPTLCELDLALMSTFTGCEVDHQECMAKNGHVCRFKLRKKQQTPQ